MKYDFSAHYINLDASSQRNDALKMNIEVAGMSHAFTRFPAEIGSKYWHPGHKIGKSELGCLLSHQALLKGQKANEITLILEDDAYLPTGFAKHLDMLLKKMESMALNVDLVFLGQVSDYSKVFRTKDLIKLQSDIMKKNREGSNDFALLDGNPWYKWGTFAYLVMPGAGKRIHDLIASTVNHELPIDELIGSLIRQNKLRAKIIFPYLVGLVGGTSTMADRKLNIDNALHVDMVNMFVHNGNVDALIADARSNLEDPDFNRSAFIYSQLIYRKIVS